MQTYETEEQQLDAIKQWIKKNGLSLLLAVTVPVAGFVAWKNWTGAQDAQHEAASVLYQEMIDASALLKNAEGKDAEKQLSTIQHLANQLIEEYPGLQYAHFAALTQAKLAVEKGDLATAVLKLQWVLAQKADKPLLNVTTVRLARVLAAQGEPDKALATLQELNDPAFQTLVEEVRGDIYLQKGDKDAARSAYQRSIDVVSDNKQADRLVQLKLDDLALAKE